MNGQWSDWLMAGRWSGEYRFGAIPGVFAGGLLSAFTLELTEGRFGLFRGSVQDDPNAGIPNPGTIRGWRGPSAVYFLKQMPFRSVRRVNPANGEVSPRLQDVNRKHPPILYRGRWYPDHQELRGKWAIFPSGTRGTWFARREF